MLDQITPVILTYNEAPNIGRTLERLAWARDIVVVDSFSSDETLAIVGQTQQARVFQREFDCHKNQWNFALKETGITSEWVLALDADYVLTPGLVEELGKLTPDKETTAYDARFVYYVKGQALRGSAYPPVTVLFKREGASYEQDGHTQRLMIEGDILDLRAPILHDDRKSFEHWVRSQARYMKLEAKMLVAAESGDLEWADRLRKMRIVAPFAILFYCLFVRGAILDGRAGIYYAFQRLLSELILSLYLIEESFGGETSSDPESEKSSDPESETDADPESEESSDPDIEKSSELASEKRSDPDIEKSSDPDNEKSSDPDHVMKLTETPESQPD